MKSATVFRMFSKLFGLQHAQTDCTPLRPPAKGVSIGGSEWSSLERRICICRVGIRMILQIGGCEWSSLEKQICICRVGLRVILQIGGSEWLSLERRK